MNHSAEKPAATAPSTGASPEPPPSYVPDAAAMPFVAAETPATYGLLPLGSEPADYAGTRVSTRTWATVAAVALLLAVVSGGAAAALWRQNAGLSRQVVGVQNEMRDFTEQIEGLSSNAEAVDGTADDLASRVAMLEHATEQLAQLEGLAQRLGALEATTQELANRPAAEPEVSSADLTALQAQIDSLTSHVNYLQSLVQNLCIATHASTGAVC